MTELMSSATHRPWLVRVTDRALPAAGGLVLLALAGAVGWLLVDAVVYGVGDLTVDFLFSMPEAGGRRGGIAPVIVSTAAILAVCVLVAGPVGLATAVTLAEASRHGKRRARVIRTSLDVLAAVPSIVFGLFGNALFCVALGMGYSILAGGLTLACMVLPLLVRTGAAALAEVPDSHRQGAAALGLSRWRTIVRVLVPAAGPGLAAGLVLSLGRALGETAALLFTSGYVMRMPQTPLDSGRTLSVHIYDLAINIPGGEPRAWATALVLLAGLAVVNAVALGLPGKLRKGEVTA